MAEDSVSYPSLRAWRRAHKLSQKAAAAQFRLSQAEWCRIENFQRAPRTKLARRLYVGTGVPIEVLMGIVKLPKTA